MRNLILGGAIVAMVALSVRSEARPPEQKLLQAPRTSPFKARTGIASWYGAECQGNYTYSGELFDMNALTCASRTLPLGALIRITNLRNSRSVVLRVNDRGPAICTRMVDVTREAARRLGFLGDGLARVRLQIVSLPKGRPQSGQGQALLAEALNY